ncbi:MAG: acetylornithine deacetylase [Caballeronia sp.]|jgi:acetylornithine deacetylase|nr:acetylornithine deacetylase [Caballeronia sp.]
MAHALLDSTLNLLDSLIAFDTRSSETNLALIDFMQQYSAGHDMELSLLFGETGRKANLLATSVRRTGRDSACPAIPM